MKKQPGPGRINIEAEYRASQRRTDLAVKVGGAFLADGIYVNMLALAEPYWYPAQRPIPLAAWRAARMPDALLECGFAELIDLGEFGQFVSVLEAKKQFEWRFKRAEGGKKSGKERAKNGKRSKDGQFKSKKKGSKLSLEAARLSPESAKDSPGSAREPQCSTSSSPSTSISSVPSSISTGTTPEVLPRGLPPELAPAQAVIRARRIMQGLDPDTGEERSA